MGIRFVEAFRPGWMKVGLSLLPAYILGWFAGPLIYNFSHCWTGDTNCAAYSPTRIVLSYVLSWPVFLVGALFENVGVYLHVGSLNPFAPEFVLLWLYYYLLVSAADYFARRRTISVVR